VSCDISGKDREGAPHEGDRTVGMTTGSSPVHVAETTFESWQKSIVTLAPGQSCQIICDGRQSKHARAALAGALIGEETSDTG
jgi:hypothetical protein